MENSPKAEQLEEQKTFDIKASVNLYRNDIWRYGQVRNETKERVCNEELSLFCEGIDAASKTEFYLKKQDDELVIFDDGWKPYLSSLKKATKLYAKEAEIDPRRTFLLSRAIKDETFAEKLNNLVPNERLTYFSSYAFHEEEQFGKSFVESCGFKPDRKMGFIYQAICLDDETIKFESQTVDMSDQEGFDAVMNYVDLDPEADLNVLTAVYDHKLFEKYGRRFYAGQLENQKQHNIWNIIKNEKEIVEYYLEGLEEIANSITIGSELESAIIKHFAGVCGLFKEKIDKTLNLPSSVAGKIANKNSQYSTYGTLKERANSHYERFVSQNQMIIVCGGAIGGIDLFNSSLSDIAKAIFGNSESSQYSFNRLMYCLNCQAPPSQGSEKKPCGPCGLCRSCDIKFGGKG